MLARELLHDLAGAVLDGRTVDWAVAESSAETDTRPIVQQLWLVSSIACFFRDARLPTARLSLLLHSRQHCLPNSGATFVFSSESGEARTAKSSEPGTRASTAKSP
ncbi:MAG TPA: hypothetical protein VLD67_10185 [Vicinamibacterales bacterium]|nr:hypothetical protein [Vicinamibacterales bacterium]